MEKIKKYSYTAERSKIYKLLIILITFTISLFYIGICNEKSLLINGIISINKSITSFLFIGFGIISTVFLLMTLYSFYKYNNIEIILYEKHIFIPKSFLFRKDKAIFYKMINTTFETENSGHKFFVINSEDKNNYLIKSRFKTEKEYEDFKMRILEKNYRNK